jgi:hypothetical protein
MVSLAPGGVGNVRRLQQVGPVDTRGSNFQENLTRPA